MAIQSSVLVLLASVVLSAQALSGLRSSASRQVQQLVQSQGLPTMLQPLQEAQKQDLYEIIGQQCEELNRMDVSYWLDRGTLIGMGRDGGITPYDDDGDLAILSKDFDKISRTFSNLALPQGMRSRKVDWGSHPYYSFEQGGMHSDIVQLVLVEGRVTDPYVGAHESLNATQWGTLARRLVNVQESAVFPVQDCKFGGYTCKCPRDINQYLSSQYGPDWYKPLPGGGYAPSNMKAYINHIITHDSKYLTNEMKAELARMLTNVQG